MRLGLVGVILFSVRGVADLSHAARAQLYRRHLRIVDALLTAVGLLVIALFVVRIPFSSRCLGSPVLLWL